MAVIYLIRNGGGLHKIGRTKNSAEDRLRQLQTGSGSDLRLVCSCAVSDVSKVESVLHRRYADRRVRGEWFELAQNEVETFEHDVSTISKNIELLRLSGNPFL